MQQKKLPYWQISSSGWLLTPKKNAAVATAMAALTNYSISIMGHVYLLHFSRPINPSRPAQHYLGWAGDLDERLRKHRKGKGSKFCQVAAQRGISFVLAEVWAGERSLERQLKRQHNSPRFCPICARSK
jgi:predicted GIY-YIG superfamily endonuclease